MPPTPRGRRILTAELLSIGSELTVGETRDTNAGELARTLTTAGVTVGRLTALPDRLDVVASAFSDALERSDLVVSTGGLGPTPDDLTRESIAAAVGETPTVDPETETWLRERWTRIGQPFPEINLKQAWRIPSARILPNPHGSAPGWLVTRADGRIAVALPGPPREMRPMWAERALPQLRAIGLGDDSATRTLRLTGIGESRVAEVLGEELLRTTDPEIATYARVEAVDVRISAVGGAGATGSGGTAVERVERATAIVRERLGSYIWAEGDTTWSQAIGGRLADRAWRLAAEEIGTGGQVAAVFGDVPWLARIDAWPTTGPPEVTTAAETGDAELQRAMVRRARRVRDDSGADVGLAVYGRERDAELTVTVAVATPRHDVSETRSRFSGGAMGRSRIALVAAAVLFAALAED